MAATMYRLGQTIDNINRELEHEKKRKRISFNENISLIPDDYDIHLQKKYRATDNSDKCVLCVCSIS